LIEPAVLENPPKFGEPMWRNDSLEHATKTVLRLIKETRDELFIVTDLDPRFFGMDEIRSAIEDAITRGVKIKILNDKKGILDKSKEIKRWKERGYIEYKEVRKTPNHFMVGDKRHVRLEKPHKFGELNVQGIIDLNNPFLGKRWATHFNKNW